MPVFQLLAFVLALLVATTATAANCDAPFPLIRKNPALQTRLLGDLRGAGFNKAIERKQLAVSLVDLTRSGEVVYSGINDDHMMYAASLPKLGILLAVFEAQARGDIVWNHSFAHKLSKMVTISDNEYATWGAKLVGLRYIADVVLDSRYCLYEPGTGGLWVGRAFEKGGETLRDPLKSISHGASTRQTARFYVMLDAERLVTPHASRRMLALMAPPEYEHKFVKALRPRHRARFVARKSGTWKNFHADSAIVQHGARRYVLVALVEHEDGESWLQDVARIADDVIAKGSHRYRVSIR